MSWDLRGPRAGNHAGALLALGVLAGLMAATATAAVPDNTTLPTITGASTARDGQTLTATNGTWANSPTSFKYQWQRCSAAGSDCTGIASATSQSYTPAAADVDQPAARGRDRGQRRRAVVRDVRRDRRGVGRRRAGRQGQAVDHRQRDRR